MGRCENESRVCGRIPTLAEGENRDGDYGGYYRRRAATQEQPLP